MAPVLLQFQSREGGASRTWHPEKRDTGEENTFNSQEIRDYSVLQLYRANQPPVQRAEDAASPSCSPAHTSQPEGSSVLSKVQPARALMVAKPGDPVPGCSNAESHSEEPAANTTLHQGMGQFCYFQQKS